MFFQRPDHGLHGLDARVEFAVGFHDGPRRVGRVRAVQHLVHRVSILRPFLAVAPILFRDFPLLERHFFAVSKPAQLFFFVDVDPELEQQRAVIRHQLFHLVDLAVRALPLLLRGKSLHALDQNAPVPRPVKNGKMPGLGHFDPEPPQVVVGEFDVIRRGDGDHLVAAWIHPPHQAFDIAPFAGGVPALVHDDHGLPLPINVVFEFPQPFLIRAAQAVVSLARECVG